MREFALTLVCKGRVIRKHEVSLFLVPPRRFVGAPDTITVVLEDDGALCPCVVIPLGAVGGWSVVASAQGNHGGRAQCAGTQGGIRSLCNGQLL